ncbi:MAG: Mrp/NBP35 family ATP-binding protein [Bacteroidales bacterium]|nr:MAG: Mrp/NBP35 family ATP-binding protein [Bacteroidales bacterium]
MISNKEPGNNYLSGVKNIVAIASGKGGVGKSTIATNLAVAMALEGLKIGILDADIFGPSLPKMLGIEEERPRVKKVGNKDIIIPVQKHGVNILSIGLFVSRFDATVWRGPMASKVLKQLITDADWGELDYMFFDLPPGTSDIHLTLVQTIPVTGAIIVSTPQEVALADAIKGISMFRGEPIDVPILGLVENMSWFTPEELPDKKYYIFGKDGCKKIADKFSVPVLGQIPIVQSLREGGDSGVPSVIENEIIGQSFKDLASNVIKHIDYRNKHIKPTKVVEITRK